MVNRGAKKRGSAKARAKHAILFSSRGSTSNILRRMGDSFNLFNLTGQRATCILNWIELKLRAWWSCVLVNIMWMSRGTQRMCTKVVSILFMAFFTHALNLPLPVPFLRTTLHTWLEIYHQNIVARSHIKFYWTTTFFPSFPSKRIWCARCGVRTLGKQKT